MGKCYKTNPAPILWPGMEGICKSSVVRTNFVLFLVNDDIESMAECMCGRRDPCQACTDNGYTAARFLQFLRRARLLSVSTYNRTKR